MDVCRECCVLSGRGLCNELITRSEESYRAWCVVVCDLETSSMRGPWPPGGLLRQKKKTDIIFTYLSQYLTNLMHKICFTISFISCLYMFREYVLFIRRSKLHYTAFCIITPIGVMIPDDEHMCSKHVEAWNKTYCGNFCASGWLNTEINALRCKVSMTSKIVHCVYVKGEITNIYVGVVVSTGEGYAL